MKITKKQLKQIIKEEIGSVLNEGLWQSFMDFFDGTAKKGRDKVAAIELAVETGNALVNEIQTSGKKTSDWVNRYFEWIKIVDAPLDRGGAGCPGGRCNSPELAKLTAQLEDLYGSHKSTALDDFDANKALGIPKRPPRSGPAYGSWGHDAGRGKQYSPAELATMREGRG